MENPNKKCSAKDHQDINAISYCQKCNIYMCNKCESLHSKLFQHLNLFKLDKDINEIFTGYCKELNHKNELEFFCKNHNQLCCAECITKIKGNGKGQHKDCDVCFLNEIKNIKKDNLTKNIDFLQSLSTGLEENINKLKELYKGINENKENLKLKIQKIFTKIRNLVNEREDKLLLEVDEKFNKYYFDENIILESQKLPDKIKISLEKGKKINEEWNDDEKLNSLINDCLNIEIILKEINNINECIQKSNNSYNIKIHFFPEEEDDNKIFHLINEFGHISEDDILNDSQIIKNNKNYIDNIINWINKNNKIKTKLLYRKSIDGDSIDTFHKLCDNQGNTLILIKVDNKNIFGGYTPLDWNETSGYKNDNDTFIFSLTANYISKKKKINNSIICSKNIGPSSCCFGLGNTDKHNMTQGNFDSSCSYYNDFSKIIPNNKPGNFEAEEVEIYKISF